MCFRVGGSLGGFIQFRLGLGVERFPIGVDGFLLDLLSGFLLPSLATSLGMGRNRVN